MSKKEIENPQAFPGSYQIEYMDGDKVSRIVNGMTLRDYFAAKAMQGLVGGVDLIAGTVKIADNLEMSSGYYLAKKSYEIADEMLKERSKS